MLNASEIRVLVACEESQVVCSAFRALGFSAYSCDLLDCSGGHPEWHIKCDVLRVLDCGWDLLIAHPPCTYMSVAGARWMYPSKGVLSFERFEKAMDAKRFFMRFYELPSVRYVAIENPLPLTVVGLPPPSQIIQPYEYGHPYSKKTLLWLKNLPCLKPTDFLDSYTTYLPSNTSRFSRGSVGGFGVAHDARTRSLTFSGVASAMAAQWGSYVLRGCVR